jgi:predicted MFS family arabinose efflux permease
MVPLVSSTLAGAPATHAGVASGVLSTLQQVGNSLGVMIVGLLYFDAQARPGFLVSLAYLVVINLVLLALLFSARPRSRGVGGRQPEAEYAEERRR